MASRPGMMKAMDALLQAGARIDNVAQWCREHGVNPRTFYRHRARIEVEGQWRERSRRPHHSPLATDPDLEAWIVKLRKDLCPDNGADFIGEELKRVCAAANPPWRVPSRSTINRVLARRELLEKNPAKRPRSSWRRFAFARPRDCYQIDATVVRLAKATNAVVFEVLDDCSRMLVACHAARAETAEAAIAAITKAFTVHGPPALVLADNGTAFTSRRVHANAGPSRFAQAVHRWGTRLIHASPYHPQTCGKVERHHQTLKKWLATQPQPATLRQLQQLLDTYRTYYNTRRPHSALRRATPHQVWTTAPSHGGPSTLPVQTDATVHRLLVSTTGTITAGAGGRIGLGAVHKGRTVTAIRDGNRVTVYDSDGHPLGHAVLTTGKNYTPLTPAPDQHATHVPGHAIDTCPGT